MELIFLSYELEELGKNLIIEENEYSIWTYIYNPATRKVEAHGFICGTTAPIESWDEAQGYAENRKPPPLAKTYANERSVIQNLKEEDFTLAEDSEGNFIILINDEPFTKLNIHNNISYSKALSQDGPYGLPWKE